MAKITDEKEFETAICKGLAQHGWTYVEGEKDNGWDRRLALYPADVLSWLKTQYPKEYEKAVPADATDVSREVAERKLLEHVANRLESKTRKDPQSGKTLGGLLGTLREGFNYTATRNSKFGPMVAFPPANPNVQSTQAKADANILRVLRQVHFDTQGNETLDLVLCVNGIPVVTMELKTDNTQAVAIARQQYRDDRKPSVNRRVLLPGRALVHFAVSNEEVYMTSELKGTATTFLPFNKGGNEGAGNPPVEDKSETHYLWEEVLERGQFLRILRDFAVWSPDAKPKRGTPGGRLIFPRYHQLRAVERVSRDVLTQGPGQKYLIQHSAGSGKTLTIAWLSHRLIRLYQPDGAKSFDSIIVVTDRNVLDTNVRHDIQMLGGSLGLIVSVGERSGAKSEQLAEAIEEGGHIITCTLQTFPFVLEKLQQADLSERSWCVIADEAHSSQTGDSASSLRKLLTNVELEQNEEYSAEDLLALEQEAIALAGNMSFVALTATPKAKTLELFGTKNPSTGETEPFDLYSMGQAIEEGFILDVLGNYSTYGMFAEVRDELGRTEEVNVGEAVSDITKFVRLHETAIAQKVQVVVEHFKRNVVHHLDGKARAMVVTSSRQAAVRWSAEMNKYINEKGYDFKSLVAFSDSIKVDDYAEPVTEVGINGISDVERAFKDDDLPYRVLIVAEKFQTGFDEPRLCAMYVDKKLSGVATVQTLSRLNRIYPNKPVPMVVDFENDPASIVADFKDFYGKAFIEKGVDPNTLHNLADEIDTAGYYTEAEMEAVAQAYMAGSDSEKLRGAAAPIVVRWRAARDSDKEGRAHAKAFKSNVRKYRRAYEFLSQIVAFGDATMSKRAMLCAVLDRVLHLTADEDAVDEDFADGITLAGVAIREKEIEVDRSLTEGSTDPLVAPNFAPTIGDESTPLRATFDEVVEKVNNLFSMAGVDVGNTATAQMIVAAWGTLSQEPEAVKLGKTNSAAQLKRSKKFKTEATKAILSGIDERTRIDTLLSSDKDMLEGVISALADIMATAKEMGKLDEE